LKNLIYDGDNDYIMPKDAPGGVWIEVDNIVLWITRGGPGEVVVEGMRANDVEYMLGIMVVKEVE
jgi:hypothetical protein